MSDGHEIEGQVGTRLLFEDEWCRVWLLSLDPDEKSPWHRHLCDYAYAVTKDGPVVTEYEDGSIERQNDPVGTVSFRKLGGPHRLINVATEAYKNIIVEFKKLNR